MKDLDLSNAEGLDESITEDYSGFIGQPNKYLLYILKYKNGIAFTDAEKADIFRIENSSSIVEKTKAASLRSQNGITAPSLILEKLIAPAPAPAPAPEPAPSASISNNESATAPSLSVGANIKSVVKDIVKSVGDKSKALEKAEKEEPKEETKEEKEEPSKVEETKKDVSKSVEPSDDKILGMPKMVAYGLGAVIVLVGGFIAYKKFKK
jgi:hypothetical protein